MMKKVCKWLIGSVVLIALLVTGYVQYKFFIVENYVTEYVVNVKGIPEASFKTEPFIANLPGEKNWMVSVKEDGNTRTYFYYVNKENQIVRESYVIDRVEHIEK